ncbi:MAG TPA: bifunctional 3-deoxy-7-phosphoheptulonate synthase/chorismate mutase [Candidatus Limnocylindrales bacterium]
MIVVMKAGAAKEEIDAVCALVRAEGLETFVSEGQERTIIGIVGIDIDRVAHVGTMPGVEQAIRVTAPHKLASLEHQRDRTRITVRGTPIGAGAPLVVMAGPCSVESPEMLFETAALVKREGAHVLRGGAFKPRTSPYAFQGLGEEGLELLAEARTKTGLPIVTEMTDASQMEVFEEFVDIIQIGSRNMHNFTLLRAAGQGRTPVLLKRGFGATIDEWLMAAEYVLSAGNANVILCERGIRTFERATRNTLDLSAVPVLREMTHLPIVVDPSHGTGKRSLVGPMSLGAAAVGADGLIVEVHPDPPHARSDGDQSLSFPEFGALMDELRRLEFLKRGSSARARRAASIPPSVEEMRERIDDIDENLLSLVDERAQLALAISEAKGTSGNGHDPQREHSLIDRARTMEGGALDGEELEQVMSAVLKASRQMQRRHAAAKREEVITTA